MMTTAEFLLARKLGSGGGGDVTVEELTVTENGIYQEQGKAYSPVNVELPLSSKTITENGTYTASDDNLAGFNEVTVAVQGYAKKSIANTPTPIATFNASALPMPSLKIGIEPVQDLHGYDSPWPAGGGKNLFDKPNLVMNKAIPQGTVIYGQIFGVTASFKLYGYDEENNEYEVMSLSINKNSTTTTRAYVRLEISQSALNALGNGNLMVSLSDFTRFEPYSNICPISGWDEANVYRTGKNFFDKDNTIIVNDKVRDDNGIEISSSGACYTSSITAVKPNTTYVLNGLPPTPNVSFRIYYLDVYGNWLSRTNTINFNSQPYSFTTPNNCGGLQFQLGKANTDFSATQLELGETATTYEAFSGTTYTTQLKDGQGNPMECYGGELVNVNGVQTLTVTHGYIASYNGETLPSTWISDRDVYAEGTTPTTGAEVVYELATPQTIPQDNLSIATQDGTNNLWADSGDVIEGSYFKELT